MNESNSDGEFIEIFSDMKKRCRRDAQKNDFTKTDKLLANLAGIYSATEDPQLKELYRMILEMMAKYKARVIETRNKLQADAIKWMNGDISDASLKQTQELIYQLLSI